MPGWGPCRGRYPDRPPGEADSGPDRSPQQRLPGCRLVDAPPASGFRILARIAAPRIAGLAHPHPVQQRQARLEFVPDPAREVLAGRILESRDLVQEAVIEALVERRERGLDLGEVHDPAQLRVDRPTDVHDDAERMPVQARAL